MIPKTKPTHPGEFIQADILDELGMTPAELAKALDVSCETINQLIN